MQENAGKCRKMSMETGGYNRINVMCAERQTVMHDRLIESWNHELFICQDTFLFAAYGRGALYHQARLS